MGDVVGDVVGKVVGKVVGNKSWPPARSRAKARPKVEDLRGLEPAFQATTARMPDARAAKLA